MFFDPKVIDPIDIRNYTSFKVINYNAKKLYKGKEYEKITYSQENKGVCWKLGNFFVLVLIGLTIVPLFRDLKKIIKKWKQIEAGKDIRVVLVAKQNLVHPQKNVNNAKPENLHVRFSTQVIEEDDRKQARKAAELKEEMLVQEAENIEEVKVPTEITENPVEPKKAPEQELPQAATSKNTTEKEAAAISIKQTDEAPTQKKEKYKDKAKSFQNTLGKAQEKVSDKVKNWKFLKKK